MSQITYTERATVFAITDTKVSKSLTDPSKEKRYNYSSNYQDFVPPLMSPDEGTPDPSLLGYGYEYGENYGGGTE